MTSLTLREIGVSNNVAEDHDVLELFAACRESVVHVAASHLLPDHVAVTTRNGFVELIDTATGEFRLFLTYLDRIPLDASLRCFSLVPSLYAASQQHHHRRRQHHLLYSLSYSNELLLGNVETGAVRVFATCESRPSVVQCDGDYIICGEGTGQVTVWRTSAEEEWDARYASSSAASTSLVPPLWKARLFDSTVVCANLHRDQLVCCSADYRCVVACVEDGVVRATLPLDLDQVVAVFALTMPSMTSLLHKSLVVCLTSRISIFTSRPARGTAASAQLSPSSVPTAEHLECWTRQGDCVVGREEVACASCLGGYLAAGTISGLVLLYSCDVAESLVKELVRFNVGYGVTGMQLFPNDTLLVVTSVGDVWRWPLCDLLRNAGASGEGEKDEATEAEPAAAAHQPPLPLAAPRVPAAPSPQDKTLHTEPRAPATPHEVSYTQKGDTEDRSFAAHDTSTLAHTPQREREATARVEEIVTAVCVGADVPLVGARSDAEEQGTPSVHLSTASASLRALSASSDNDGDEDHPDERGNDNTDMDARRAEPATVSCFPPPPPLASPTVSDKFEEKRGVGGVTRCATEFQRRTLYDPEQSTEEPGVVDMGVPSSAAGNSADLSHDDLRIAVSPPSTADTTAHHDAALEDSGADVPEVAARGSATGAAAVAAKEGTISDKHIQPFQSNHGDLRDTAGVAQGTVHSSPGITSTQGTGMKAAVDDLEHEFAHAMKRLLGPTVGVEGLRKDRRMNPRKVAGVLANLTNQQAAAAGGKGLSYEAPSQPRALEGPNSTKLLEEKRATLEAAAFDFEAYRQAHRLEVDALQYHHTVRAPTYTLQDRVFDAVESAGRLCDKEAGRATGAAGNAAATLPAAPEDELRDVTYGKVKWTLDPQIAEERRRGGPEMAQHHCDHLIFSTPYPAKTTVLFAEEAPLMPSTAWEEVLLLPLPLPPAPSVF